MALPNKQDLLSLNKLYYGEPIVSVAVNTSIDLRTLNNLYYGEPVVFNNAGAVTPTPTTGDDTNTIFTFDAGFDIFSW